MSEHGDDAPRKVAQHDLDNTLAHFKGRMREELKALRSPNEPPLPEIHTEQDPGWLKARRRLIKSQPGFWRDLKPYQPGFRVLRMCIEIGYDNHILTKGPSHHPPAWSEKLEWSHEHVPGLPLTVTEHDKSLNYGRVLNDDWPEYFMPWLKHRPRGLVIAVEQPWNRDIVHPQVVVYRFDKNEAEVRERLQAAWSRP